MYPFYFSGEWNTWYPFEGLGVGLKGSTVGIVGFGRIGLAVAKLLSPFGVGKIIYNSRSEKAEGKNSVNYLYYFYG